MIALTKAKTFFADNLTLKHQKTNPWTWNLSQGLLHLAKALEEIEAKQREILTALRQPK